MQQKEDSEADSDGAQWCDERASCCCCCG